MKATRLSLEDARALVGDDYAVEPDQETKSRFFYEDSPIPRAEWPILTRVDGVVVPHPIKPELLRWVDERQSYFERYDTEPEIDPVTLGIAEGWEPVLDAVFVPAVDPLLHWPESIPKMTVEEIIANGIGHFDEQGRYHPPINPEGYFDHTTNKPVTMQAMFNIPKGREFPGLAAPPKRNLSVDLGDLTTGVFGDVPDVSLCETTSNLPRTRMGLAERVAHHYGEVLKWRPAIGQWMVYDGKKWVADDADYAAGRVRTVIRSISAHELMWAEQSDDEVQTLQQQVDELTATGNSIPTATTEQLKAARARARGAHAKFAESCENNLSWATGVLVDLRSLLTIAEEQWDAHPFKINFPNGTINLKHCDEDGLPTIGLHSPTDYITMVTAVDYEPNAENENRDLDSVRAHIEQSGPGAWEALTRYLGYGITGSMDAKTYLNIWSPPDAAKSTLINAAFEALGGIAPTSYSATVSPDAFGARKDSGPQPELDSLRGKRFVSIPEAEHCYLGSDLVKRWTGGDTIYTHRKNANGGMWKPSGKLILIGNGMTPFASNDTGMVSRLFGIPLTPLPKDKVDTQLSHRLGGTPEGRKAVLALLVRAATEWYFETRTKDEDPVRGGGISHKAALHVPDWATKATQESLRENNPLAEWLEECCILGDEADLDPVNGRATASWLMDSYNEHANKRGLARMGSHRKFAGLLLPLLPEAVRNLDTPPTSLTVELRDGVKVRVDGRFRLGIRMSNMREWTKIVRSKATKE